MDPLALHRDAIVCDLHVDTLQRIAKGESMSGHGGHLDLPRAQRGGLDLQFFAVWVDPVYLAQPTGEADRSYERAMALLDAFDREVGAQEDLQAVTTAAQAKTAVANGRIAAALGIEGGHAIENDLDKLQEFYDRGVRYLGLTWNNTTEWADAAKEETLQGSRHQGLTAFGEEVVRRMNDLGMIVDLSHAAESTFWKVLEVSKAPVMASHSNAHALTPHYRNLKDEQIQALATKGGIIGINFFCAFLDDKFARDLEKFQERFANEIEAIEKEHAYDFPTQAEIGNALFEDKMGRHTIDAHKILDHMQHIVNLVGAEHVALGSDFDGTMALPRDVPDVEHLPRVTELMMERGFSDRDIRKILGDNVLRFFEGVCG